MVRSETIWTYILFAQGNVKYARLANITLQGSQTLWKLFKKCKHLAELTLQTGGILGSSLKHASSHARNLRSLSCGVAVVVDTTSLITMINSCPNLAVVSCSAIQHTPPTNSGQLWTAADYPNLQLYHISMRNSETNSATLVSNDISVEFNSTRINPTN